MSSNPLDAYREFDPKLIEHYERLAGLTYSEGALPAKFKLLIAMAIDVEHGALQGAIALLDIEPSKWERQKKKLLKLSE